MYRSYRSLPLALRRQLGDQAYRNITKSPSMKPLWPLEISSGLYQD